MGIRTLIGNEAGCPDRKIAVLFDSVTETALGPVFMEYERHDGTIDDPVDMAQDFLDFCARKGAEPRSLRGKELEVIHGRWRKRFELLGLT